MCHGKWNVDIAATIERIGVRAYGYDRFAANGAARWRLGEAGFRLLRRAQVLLRPLREVELVAVRPADR
jgi:hypothetical protein